MVTSKGKEKVTDRWGKGKRKLASGGDDDKTGRKRNNRGVLQFFEDSAYQTDEDEDSSDDSMFDIDDFLEDECTADLQANNQPGKVPNPPFVPKEEEMTEEELERMLGERYKPGAGFVTYAEDDDHKNSIDRDIYVPSAKDLTIWRVKCMVGRERHSAFCLMQKCVDLEKLGKKLQIISACALDHVKGFIFIEAEKQNDIYEACKGLPNIYTSKVAAVPPNEFSRLLTFRSKSSGLSEGMWARVKSGKYKGDLALVEAVNHVRKKVTVKLIPRIDLKALAAKFGGGVPTKRNAIPAQRLISASELEEFGPLIQTRRDRDTNQVFEVLDGMMLKDGYLYKKISIDSLSFWGANPTEDELLKFEPAKNDESTNAQFLSQLFGEKKKKEVESVKLDKGGGKSEGSSSTSVENNFELLDLVFFGRKDFGVAIGIEKDDTVKIIKEGPEGPSVVNVKQSDLKSASFDKKLFSVLDQHSNILSVNDSVRVLDGPLKDKQGVVKKIYKGVLFLCDESEHENNGYTCVKAKLCEKLNLSGDASNEKGSEPEPSGFADLVSSPNSPLCPEKSWQEKDNKSNFSHDDNAMFSIGQSLRIRVGPLKGYLCRVVAIRRSDITVKLDSQHKILTVKCDHLSEVRGRNSAVSQGDGSGSLKPFDFLGSQDGAKDWMDGAAVSTQDDQWNAGGSTERSSWSTLPSSNSLLKESDSGNPVDDGANREGSSWQIKTTPDQNSSWGAAVAKSNMAPESGSHDGWAKPVDAQQHSSGETLKDDSWGKAAEKWSTGGEASGTKSAWGQSGVSTGKETGGWGVNAGGDSGQPQTSAWAKNSVSLDKPKENSWQGISGGSKLDIGSSPALGSGSGAWGNAGGALSEVDAGTSWKNSADKSDNQTGWNTKKAGEDSTDKHDGKSSWGNTESTSSWSKPAGGSSWGNDTSLSKSVGKSTWGQQADLNAEGNTKSWNTGGQGGDQGSGGWKKGGMESRDAQEASWGNSKPFDGGRGSWGGRGRGRGRGRSFDQGQSASWNKEDQHESRDVGKGSSWSSSQTSNWGNAISNEGSKKNDDWGKANVSGKDEGSAWGSANSNADNKSSSWGMSKGTNNSSSSGWGKSSNANDEAGAAGNEQSSWDKGKKPTEDSKSSWNTSTTSLDGNKASENSGWGQKSGGNGKDGWGSSLKDEKNGGGGGSSAGWGQSNWGKSGASETGGNQDSTWSSKSNWSSGGGFGGSNNQDDTSNDGGRGGGWRGGRGGRGDRGGFRGRGRSDRGGFGGRGGSDYGGFGGSGGSDRGGFEGRGRGRGGFRGRGGRSDWNNRDDSNGDKSYSWKSSDSEGWKSGGGGGSWKQRDGDNNPSQSWNQAKGDASQGGSWGSDSNQKSSWNQPKGDATTGGWGKEKDSTKDIGTNGTGASGWGSSNASATEASTGWGKPSTIKETGGWGSSNASATEVSTGWGKPSANKETGGSGPSNASAPEVSPGWGKPSSNKETSGWGSSSASAPEVSTGWGKTSANKETTGGSGPSNASATEVSTGWGKPSVEKETGGGWNKKPDLGEGSSVNSNNSGNPADTDTWGKAKTSSWGGGGSEKGGGW